MEALVDYIYIFLKKHTLGSNNSLYHHLGPFLAAVLQYGSGG